MGISKLSAKPDEMLGATFDGLAFHPGGVAILLFTSSYLNRNKLQQYTQARLVRHCPFCLSPLSCFKDNLPNSTLLDYMLLTAILSCIM